MLQQQSQECFEHHMLLKESLEKIHDFLFGSPERSTEVSFVSKVNLMFDELKFIKQCLICSIITVLGTCIFIGKQLHKLEILSAYMERQQQIEFQLAKLEVQIEKRKE